MRAGQLIELRDGVRQAVVTEQGASLYRIIWDDAEILATVSEDGYAGPGCHGQLLMPWTGRVPEGKYSFEGQDYQLPINDHGHHAAIHGWTRWQAWQVREHTGDSVRLWHRLLATPPYPFVLELEQTYAWGRDGLMCATEVKNVGDATAPFGFGAHPYFTVGAPTIDSGLLQLPARQYFESGPRLTPQLPALPVDASPYDYRQPRPVGQAQLDVTFTALDRDASGRAVARFSSADASRTITCRYDESIGFLQVYSGDTLKTGQREGLAIEPYTCAPDAFNNGLGLLAISPGGAARFTWSISVS